MASQPTIIEESTGQEAASAVETQAGQAAAEASIEQAGTAATEAAAQTDWRAEFATNDNGEVDEKLLGWLGRFQSKQSAMAAAKKDRDAIASGKYIKPLGDNPSEEEIASFRAMFGVPDKAEGYLEKLPDGLVIGDDDRENVDKFVAAMHTANAPKPVVEAALSAYYDMIDAQHNDLMDKATAQKTASELALNQEWGADYKRNINSVKAFLGTLPEAVQEAIGNGVGPDGLPIGNNPDVIKWLTGMALETNPHVTVVPGAGADQLDAIAGEIEKIEGLMGNRASEYWRGDKDATGNTRLQNRLLQLYAARDKLGA